MTTFKRHRGLTEQAADAAVDQACRMLRLPTIRAQFPELAEAAARDQMSYRGSLAELLMSECDDRAHRRSERRIKAAAFPREKSMRAFDFEANPNVDPAVIHTLATCEWVKKGLPLCLIGDSGTGKSHLLIALGTEAAMAGYRVRYTLATKLVKAQQPFEALVVDGLPVVQSTSLTGTGEPPLCSGPLGDLGRVRTRAQPGLGLPKEDELSGRGEFWHATCDR